MFTKLFRIRIKIRLKLTNILLLTFLKTHNNYLNIDCWYLIKYVLRTRLLVILSFFMKEKVNFIIATVMKNWSPLNNRINFIIVNCLICILGLKQHLHVNGYINQIFLNRECEIAKIIHFET